MLLLLRVRPAFGCVQACVPHSGHAPQLTSPQLQDAYGAGRPVSAYEAAISDRTVRMCMDLHIACILAPGQNEPKRSARGSDRQKRTRRELIPNT